MGHIESITRGTTNKNANQKSVRQEQVFFKMAKSLLIVCAFTLLAADLVLMKKEKDENLMVLALDLSASLKFVTKNQKVGTPFASPSTCPLASLDLKNMHKDLRSDMRLSLLNLSSVEIWCSEDLPSRSTLYFFATLHSIETLHKDFHHPFNTFKAMDTNKDHVLSHPEVKAFLIASGVKDEAGDHGLKQMLRDIFNMEDIDNNGFISHKEFSGNKHDYV